MAVWLVVLLVAGAGGFSVDDASYFEMPRLFQLDELEACAAPGSTYCLGSFALRGRTPFLKELQEFSSHPLNFNHTRLHRGWCVSARCPGGGEKGEGAWFEGCVSNSTWRQYGLRATLQHLEYCRGASLPARPLTPADIVLFAVAAVILLLNTAGTIYDILRDSEIKPNKYLIAWSLVANWRRLTATYHDGDPRLSALKPLQGLKALSMVVVIMAHTMFTYYMSYLVNPQFLERTGREVYASFFFNGTLIVQTFILISNFLLAYNLLLRGPDMGFSLWPKCMMHRLARIVPVYLFVVGLAATWWERLGDGALWAPLVGAEATRCRRKFWTHALFLHNFIDTDEKCLVQTWFIGVDIQLYAVMCLLLIALVKWSRGPRGAILTLSVLFVCSIIANGVIAYVWEFKPIMYYMRPEYLRSLFRGVASFSWMYAAPWGSLPTALLGLLAAFVLHVHVAPGDTDDAGIQLRDQRWFRWLYRASVPSLIAWVVAGHWLVAAERRPAVAVLAAVDRPVFALLVAIAMIGFICKVDDLWWRFLSWRGFQILGRLSLPLLMLHWSFNLTYMGLRTQPSTVSVLEPIALCLGVMFVSLASALPLTLLLELPAQRFLQAFT